ncbi:unnamed protein product [Closterium sp. NIES-53]
MRRRSGSGDLGRLSATCLRTSCPLVLLLASSWGFPLTHLGGSSTTPPLAVFCPPRTSRLTSRSPGGAEPGGTATGGAELGGTVLGGAEPRGAATGGAEPWGALPGGASPGCAAPGGAELRGAMPGGSPSASSLREPLSPQELCEWFARRWRRAAGAGGSSATEGAAVAGPGGARTVSTEAAGPASSTGAGAAEGVGTETTAGGPAGGPPGAAGGSGATGGAAGEGAPAGGIGAVPAVSGVAARPRPYFVPLLEQVLGSPPSTGLPPSLVCPQPVPSQLQLQPTSPLPAPSPYTGPTGGLAERREPTSRPASPGRAARTSGRGSRQRPPPVPGTHRMSLRPSTASLRVPLPSPPKSSLPALADPESDSLRAASPTVTRLLATVVTDPSFESTAASALVTELVDFAACCRLDYAASLVTESESVCPPSVRGECALGTDVLEDRQEEFQCLAAASPHLVSVLLTLEGDPDALDIPTPRSYAEAIEGPYSSQWQAAMDAEMASWKSTGGSSHSSCLCSTPLRRRSVTLRRTDRSSCRHGSRVLQRFGFTYSSPQATPLPTRHSLSALPSDESVESSGPYPELVGCLMYLMTCTRPDLAYPLSILARYVAPGRHRPEHMAAAKRVLPYLCSTSGMGLVLGGRSPVVLTGHADASWADDQTTQRSSQGYTISLGSGSVSWRATRSSSVLGSSCEAEIYAGAMAAQELRRLTYLLTDLGEPPRSHPVLYVDNKAMLALCREQRLEHRTKHIALRYFLARELRQRGQLRLAYVASEANTADVFTKALAPCDHQRLCTQLGLVIPAAALTAAVVPASVAPTSTAGSILVGGMIAAAGSIVGGCTGVRCGADSGDGASAAAGVRLLTRVLDPKDGGSDAEVAESYSTSSSLCSSSSPSSSPSPSPSPRSAHPSKQSLSPPSCTCPGASLATRATHSGSDASLPPSTPSPLSLRRDLSDLPESSG